MGTLVNKCGDEYIGSWKEGLKHGKGRLVTAGGGALCGGNEFTKRKNRFSTTPKREEENRKQKFNNVKGNIHIYEGNWLDGKKCGVGKIVYHSGVVFEGELEDDNPVKVIIIYIYDVTSNYVVCIITRNISRCNYFVGGSEFPRRLNI